MAFRIPTFTGLLPRIDSRLLPESGSTVAQNVLLTAGIFEPIYAQAPVQTLTNAEQVHSVYRMYDGDTAYWLAWTEDVDVARAPIAGDTSFRVYLTSDEFEPRVTNLAMAIAGSPYPYSWYVLGVTPPTTAPVYGSITGGTAPTESRSYVYTFVTQWGEESSPSPAMTATTGNANGTWNINTLQVAPGNTYVSSVVAWAADVLTFTVPSTFGLRAGEYVTLSGLAPTTLNIAYKVTEVTSSTQFKAAFVGNPGTITDQVGTATRVAPHNTTGWKQRFYRTVTTAAGTDFYYVGEQAAGATYADSTTALNIGEPLPTTGWAMPPAGLRGIATLPSGAMVGFVDNELCFSEPLAPYAWPLAYRLTCDYPIVGIGVFGQSVAVGTEGTPYIAAGVTPESTNLTKLNNPWPNLSKRSTVPVPGGVAYPSTYGLVLVSDSGAQLFTERAFTQREWLNYYPGSMIAGVYSGRLFLAYTDGDLIQGTLVINMVEGDITTTSEFPHALFGDQTNGNLYTVIGNKLQQWVAESGIRLQSEWRSKTFVAPYPVSLGAAKLDAKFTMTPQEIAAVTAAILGILAENAAIMARNVPLADWKDNGPTTTTIAPLGGLNCTPCGLLGVNDSYMINTPSARWDQVQFTLYTDGTPVYTCNVYTDKVFRLPATGKYDNFQFTVSANIPVRAIVVGDTPLSLKAA